MPFQSFIIKWTSVIHDPINLFSLFFLLPVKTCAYNETKMLPDYIVETLDKIAMDEGFSDYNIDTTAGSAHGDNFQGTMISVTIAGTKDEETSELILVVKTPPANTIRRKIYKSDLVFDREIYTYTTILPHFVNFQQEKELSEADSFLSFPKIYACEMRVEKETYFLIMEDLRAKNFIMYRNFVGDNVIPVDHELMVMRELGKFHAISFAMKDQRPDEFEKYKDLKDPMGEFIIHGKSGIFIKQSLQRVVEDLIDPKHKNIVENFRNNYVNIYDEFLYGASSQEFAIISHGDFWNNNIMFKYADTDVSWHS